PEDLMLLDEPSRADAELEATFRQVIDGNGLFREQGRVAEGVAAHEYADPGSAGDHRQPGEQRPGLEHRVVAAHRGEKVVGKPEAVEAERLEPPPSISKLRPGPGLNRVDAELIRGLRRCGHVSP